MCTPLSYNLQQPTTKIILKKTGAAGNNVTHAKLTRAPTATTAHRTPTPNTDGRDAYQRGLRGTSKELKDKQ